MIYSLRNVLQLDGRTNNKILGVKGIKASLFFLNQVFNSNEKKRKSNIGKLVPAVIIKIDMLVNLVSDKKLDQNLQACLFCQVKHWHNWKNINLLSWLSWHFLPNCLSVAMLTLSCGKGWTVSSWDLYWWNSHLLQLQE